MPSRREPTIRAMFGSRKYGWGVELVVLVDDDGNPVGTAEKATVHGARTPRHLAFSCYGFDEAGRLLVTRRARDKTPGTPASAASIDRGQPRSAPLLRRGDW